MLKPNKHTDIKYSVIYIAGFILKYLKDENILKYDDITMLLINELGEKAKYNINNTFTFLFSINKIQYLKDLDAISLINE